ncbi:MAG: methyltransferase domain-containing protein [Candidatus Kaelpia imicola]|nr:methyltransferase domain-containing protein [Candidatus Kaelpia imicola]
MSVFDRYYKKYDNWYDKNKSAYLSELKAVRKVLPKSGKGLEIGVGTGQFAHALGVTIGIDPSRNMLKIAEERGVDVRLGYGEYLPFEDSHFDYVTIIISLCFVKDPKRVLEEVKRVLKDNGKIIIGILDKNSFLGKFYQKKKSLFYKKASFFSTKDVTDLLDIVGFNKFDCYQTIFDLPDKIRSIEEPQKGFNRGGFVVVSAEKI